jgi:GNAT superfamily N-acetyltransferase
MMIRLATAADIPGIFKIRDGAGANRLSDPSVVTQAHVRRSIDNAALWVWQEDAAPIAGFSGSDARDGSIWALLVAPGHEGKGIGRALLKAACDGLRGAGLAAATIALEPDTPAERHYRAAGWTDAGTTKGELILTKPL